MHEFQGTPVAYFPNTQCNISKFFGVNHIIINLTFCGDWAGNAYPSSCPSTCVDYVNNNPSAFVNAYWQITSLRVYQKYVFRSICLVIGVSVLRSSLQPHNLSLVSSCSCYRRGQHPPQRRHLQVP